MPLGMLRGGNSGFYLNTTGSGQQKVTLRGLVRIPQSFLVHIFVTVWFTMRLPCSCFFTFLKLCFGVLEAIGQGP